jgi:hypothetical protein
MYSPELRAATIKHLANLQAELQTVVAQDGASVSSEGLVNLNIVIAGLGNRIAILEASDA